MFHCWATNKKKVPNKKKYLDTYQQHNNYYLLLRAFRSFLWKYCMDKTQRKIQSVQYIISYWLLVQMLDRDH